MFQTFTGVKNLHDSGYYHDDLGDQSSIMLEGTLDNWDRAVIVNNEENKITYRDQINQDIETLTYMIWQIIVGNICIIEDKNEDPITPGHPKFIKFIKLVKYSAKKLDDYSKYLKVLLWIFKKKPRIVDIIDKI